MAGMDWQKKGAARHSASLFRVTHEEAPQRTKDSRGAHVRRAGQEGARAAADRCYPSTVDSVSRITACLCVTKKGGGKRNENKNEQK